MTARDLERFRRFGRNYGYPKCCIEAWVADVAAGRHPAVLRGSTLPRESDGETWVPCPACRARIDLEQPPTVR